MFKVVMADQWYDHFDVIPLNNGPTKGMVVSHLVEDDGLQGMIVDSLGVDIVDSFGPLLLKRECLVCY